MMSEFCPECGAEITGNTGFCQECGATTKSLEEKIVKERREYSKNQWIKKLKRYFHKEDKDNKFAIFYSLFVPFLGSFYLKENIINFVLACCSIFVMVYAIFNLFANPDFTYLGVFALSLLVFCLLWIVSIIYLIILINGYKTYKKEYLDNPQDYLEESQFSVIAENQYLKFLPILLIVLMILAYGLSVTDASDKIFEYETFTIEYPSEYYVSEHHYEESSSFGEYDGIYFYPKNSESDDEDYLEIQVSNFSGSLSDYKNSLFKGVTYKDTKLLGMPAIDVGENYRFVKDGKSYLVRFQKGGQSEDIFKTIKFE